jgi:5-methylcytosine-specific restriction protein A
LIGVELSTPTESQPNRILAVERGNFIVATEDSPAGSPASLAQLQRGIDRLFAEGEVRISTETFEGHRRSSAIGAVLAALHGVEMTSPPTFARLSLETPLRDQLIEACSLTGAPRTTGNVSSQDPLYQLMVHRMPATLRGIVGRSMSYKIQGSAGQVNFPWAETPWAAIFDRLVTESAQRGHYLAFLFHPAGRGVYLSLNQAVTEMRTTGGGNVPARRLLANATRLRSFIAPECVRGLITEPLDLAARGERTRGYEMANVAATYFSADQVPHDAVLACHLLGYLAIYESATSGVDAEEAASSVEVPDEARTGTESKRYRWHLRAEGRNRAVVRRAKELRDYSCQVCGRRFVDEFGELGKRCVDAHHLSPFSELDSRPRNLDARTDFAVVCANCHRMLHSETPPVAPEELARWLADETASRRN